MAELAEGILTSCLVPSAAMIVNTAEPSSLTTAVTGATRIPVTTYLPSASINTRMPSSFT